MSYVGENWELIKKTVKKVPFLEKYFEKTIYKSGNVCYNNSK